MSRKKKSKVPAPADPVSTRASTQPHPFPIKHALAVSFMAVFALMAYANTFYVPFHFDDDPNIVLNASTHLRTFSLQWVNQLIQANYKESLRIFAYFTFALNYYVGGLQVFGYHLVNLLIHLSCGILLYAFILLTLNLPSLKDRYGSKAFPIALFSSLLFLVHPIQTQSVTYIVQRMASMAGMFYLLAMVLYVKGRLSSGWKRLLFWAATVLSYLLGLFTKENVAILPLFIGLYEFYFFQRFDLGPQGKKRLVYLAGSVLAVGVLIFLVWGRRYIGVIIEGFQIRDFTLTERVLTQFRVVLYYVTLLALPLPSRLNLDYDFPTSHGILDPATTLLSIVIVVGLIGYSIVVARKRPLLSYFILWYFGNLVIESSIFPLEMVYEHRLYLPAIGPIVLFVVFVLTAWERMRTRATKSSEFGVRGSEQKAVHSHLTDRSLKRTTATDTIIWCFFLAVTVLMVWGSYERNKVWQDPVTLWEDCVKKSPGKDRTHYNVGLAYHSRGRYKEAIESFQKAILLNPGAQDSYHNLGIAFRAVGSNLAAVEANKKSVQLKPADVDAINNLGLAYKAIGSYPMAIDAFKEALRIKPGFPLALNNLGLTYTETKQYEEAVETLKKAIQAKPDEAEFRNNLGAAYRKMGKFQEALEAYQDAIRLRPEFPDAINNLGLALYGMRRYPEAVKAFEQAIRLKPKDGEFHYNLGVTYNGLSDQPAAIRSYQEAILINPDHNKARFNLGLTYLFLKKREQALEQYQALKDRDRERAEKLFSLINSSK